MFNYLETKNIIALVIYITNSDFTLAFEFLYYLSFFNPLYPIVTMRCVFSRHFVNSNALKVCAASRVQNIYQLHPQLNENIIFQPQKKFAWQIDVRISKST